MAKELMWICALLDESDAQPIVQACKEANKSVGLSESVFKFALHISLKKSFYTTDFEALKKELLSLLHTYSKIECVLDAPVLKKGMIWMPVSDAKDLRSLHSKIDQRLLEKFDIQPDPFDVHFEPHVSLFTKGNKEQMQQLAQSLQEMITPVQLELSSFVIGSSRHQDEIISIK
jgi:2'-5' RNA ligase